MDKARIKYQLETALALPVDVLAAAIGGEPSTFEAIARKKAVLLTTAKAEV